MKKNLSIFIIILSMNIGITWAQNAKEQRYIYESVSKPWQESLGNHRAVITISKATSVASLDFEWRRHDANVDKRRFIIVDATSGDTVKNIKRVEVNNERCKIMFGPIKEVGTYFFYYLPYKVELGGGFYSSGYMPQEKAPSSEWAALCDKTKAIKAKVEKVQSRTAFDSFYPMEIAATANEVKNYKAKNKTSLYLFPENRAFPIRMKQNLPIRWLNYKQGTAFTADAQPNEYYTLQIGLWASDGDIKNVEYSTEGLVCGNNSIPKSAITCFNTEGVNPYGEHFTQKVDVAKDAVQALWFGFDIAKGQPAGEYKGSITITANGGLKKTLPISIKVGGQEIADRGDSEPWRYSRLRWLNSTLGINDTPTAPYTDMSLYGNKVSCYNRDVTVDMTTGMPAQINSWGNDMLASPMRFVIETDNGVKNLRAMPSVDEQTAGKISESWKAEDEDLVVSAKAVMEFDGWANYIYTITPKKDINVKDVRLELNMRNEVAPYFLGAGLPGQDTPQEYEGKWDAPEKTVNNFGVSIATDKKQQWLWPFDSFWIGSTHAGIHCEFRGSTYSGPLLNSYRPAYPESWNNGGKGGFKIKKGDNATLVTAYSGARTLKSGQPITFDFALLITPVKPIDMKAQFDNRYYHNGSKPVPTDEDVKAGVKIINIHHANEYNPFINYPFLSVDKVRNFTSTWHKKGCKVKLYYTLRELTSATTEIWAIRSLGHEILRGGKGGGFPWCREHFVTDYTPQWYQHFEHIDDTGIVADAAILTSESNSRWYNYYIEGLRWMVANLDIDGIYLDDVSFDRRILKRMRRAMDSVKPGCIIDLHSNTGFSKGPANQYAEFFPYVDKLWFGESFLYDQMTPTNWLVESSGIPFGLTGDMLYRGGNKWLGMQYGMTVRHPWMTEGVICDPRVVWKVWDDFGIDNAIMQGFWENNPIVTTTDNDVKVTTYRKGNTLLLSIGNYTDDVKEVKLNIDWKQLGWRASDYILVAPEVPTFQPQQTWNISGTISVKPRQGWLIYLQPNKK